MAMQKYILTTNAGDQTLVSGAKGLLTEVIFVNPTENPVEVKLLKDDTHLYYYRNLAASSTYIETFNTYLGDEVLNIQSNAEGVYITANIIEDN